MKTDPYQHIDGLHGQRITKFDLAIMHDRYTVIYKPELNECPPVRLLSASYIKGIQAADAWACKCMCAEVNVESARLFWNEQKSIWALEQASCDGLWSTFERNVWQPHCLGLQFKKRKS